MLFSYSGTGIKYKGFKKKKKSRKEPYEPELHLEGRKCANFLLLNKKEKSGNHPSWATYC